MRCAIIEVLERRLVLSAQVIEMDGVLSIIGDSAPQTVRIVDALNPPQDTAAIVSVDADGNGSFEDPGDTNAAFFQGITRFVVRLGGGDDAFSFRLGNNYQAADKALDVATGVGNDTALFAVSPTELIGGASQVAASLRTGAGNDAITLSLSRLTGESSLDLAVNAGAGDDRLVTLAMGDIDGGSRLNVAARLGAGQDTFDGRLDYESFDIPDADSAMSVQVRGEAGNDSLILRALEDTFQGATTFLEGQLAVDLGGGQGRDEVAVDLTPLTLNGGTAQIAARGGAQADTVRASFAARSESTGGVIDAALLGGKQADVLEANVQDLADTSTFAQRGSVLVNGGQGFDTCTTSGDAPFDVVLCEA